MNAARARSISLAAAIAVVLGGCVSTRHAPPPPAAGAAPPPPVPPPPQGETIPDAVPRYEPRSIYGNPPFYDVFGKRYYRPVLERRLCRAGRRLLVWPGLSQGTHLDRRDLRHVRHDRRAQDAAPALLRAGHEPAERPQHRGPRQRPRTFRRQPHHRSVLHRGREARHAAKRHRHGRGPHRRAGGSPGRDTAGAVGARRRSRRPSNRRRSSRPRRKARRLGSPGSLRCRRRPRLPPLRHPVLPPLRRPR